jgi:hypothetical protein
MFKQRHTLVLSLLANGGLAVALACLLTARSPRPAPSNETAPAEPNTSPATETAPEFNWRQLESPDYRTYIANLRAVGCPEETIRNIILPGINQVYAAKNAALVPPEGPNYWEWPRPGAIHSNDRQETLFQEKRTLVRDLLGIDILAENRTAALARMALR